MFANNTSHAHLCSTIFLAAYYLLLVCKKRTINSIFVETLYIYWFCFYGQSRNVSFLNVLAPCCLCISYVHKLASILISVFVRYLGINFCFSFVRMMMMMMMMMVWRSFYLTFSFAIPFFVYTVLRFLIKINLEVGKEEGALAHFICQSFIMKKYLLIFLLLFAKLNTFIRVL